MIKPLEIGSLKIAPPVISAPMAGVTSYPYRKMAKQFGAALVCSEMVSAKALVMGSGRTHDLTYIGKDEHPVAVQIFGAEPKIMAEAAKKIEDKGADILDVNMGCPVPKVLKTGGGASLLKDIGTAAKIIEALKKAVKIPVTAKTRIGWADDFLGLELALALQESGVDAMAFHARTRSQKYSGQADLEKLKMVKEALRIPVIGSGDIFSAQDAVGMIRATSVDGVMIARGALGNPWIFSQIKNSFKDIAQVPEPSFAEKIDQAITLFEDVVDFFGDTRGIRIARSHILWFLKGIPNSHPVKEKIVKMKRKEDVLALLVKYKEQLID